MEELQAEKEILKREILELNQRIQDLRVENETLRSENETLRSENETLKKTGSTTATTTTTTPTSTGTIPTSPPVPTQTRPTPSPVKPVATQPFKSPPLQPTKPQSQPTKPAVVYPPKQTSPPTSSGPPTSSSDYIPARTGRSASVITSSSNPANRWKSHPSFAFAFGNNTGSAPQSALPSNPTGTTSPPSSTSSTTSTTSPSTSSSSVPVRGRSSTVAPSRAPPTTPPSQSSAAAKTMLSPTTAVLSMFEERPGRSQSVISPTSRSQSETKSIESNGFRTIGEKEAWLTELPTGIEIKVFSLESLRDQTALPQGVNERCREIHLNDSDFLTVFKSSRDEFYSSEFLLKGGPKTYNSYSIASWLGYLFPRRS